MATSVSVRKHGRLTVRIDRDGHALVVRVLGDLDIASAPALEDSLRHVLESGAPSIVLDLTGVTLIDPTGLRALLWAAGELTQRRGSPSDRREVGRGPPNVEAAARRAAADAGDRCLELGRPRRLCGRAGPGLLMASRLKRRIEQPRTGRPRSVLDPNVLDGERLPDESAEGTARALSELSAESRAVRSLVFGVGGPLFGPGCSIPAERRNATSAFRAEQKRLQADARTERQGKKTVILGPDD